MAMFYSLKEGQLILKLFFYCKRLLINVLQYVLKTLKNPKNLSLPYHRYNRKSTFYKHTVTQLHFGYRVHVRVRGMLNN